MKVEHIQAKDAPAPGGSYSHGVVANGFLYTCGMGPVDPATGKIVDGGVAEQTRQTLKNLQKQYQNLVALGRESGKVAKGLKQEIDNLDKSLKKNDASVGKFGRTVGGYKCGLLVLQVS